MDCYAAAEKWFRPIWPLRFDEVDIDDLQECLDDCPKGKRTRENMKALAGLLYKYAIPRHLADLNLGQYLIVGAGDTSEKQATAGRRSGGHQERRRARPGRGLTSWRSVTWDSGPASCWP